MFLARVGANPLRRVSTCRTTALAMLAACAAFLPSRSPLSAQEVLVVRGKVLDNESEQPIPFVEVFFYAEGGSEGERGNAIRSDTAGVFELVVPTKGRYLIGARRVGYAPTLSPAYDAAVLQGVEIVIRLAPQPTALGTVLTTRAAKRENALIEGFNQRRHTGLGTYYTREEIKRRGEPPLLALVRDVAGLRISGTHGRQTATMARSSMVRFCQAVLFVDGVRMNRSDDGADVVRGLYESLTGNVLEAVEIYRGRSQLPAEFGHPDVRCGAIVVWTRKPEIEPKEPKKSVTQG